MGGQPTRSVQLTAAARAWTMMCCVRMPQKAGHLPTPPRAPQAPGCGSLLCTPQPDHHLSPILGTLETKQGEGSTACSNSGACVGASV